MKIAFITSSLEPGRDGVGDYTRRLAGELIRQGHGVRVISLNDKVETRKQKAESRNENHISDFDEMQRSEGTDIECLRLPESLRWPDRVRLAREWLEEFNPDWVSLQFVPFGFHPKGLCFGLGEKLSHINSKARWHIMFHELWLGLGEKSPVKHRFWGAMQRRIVQDLAKRLRPQVVHTQADPYWMALSREGITASILPLFSNIPYVKGDAWKEILEPLIVKATGRSPNRKDLYLAGVFGGVHPEWSAEKTVEVLLPLAQRFQKHLVLIFFGKNSLMSEAFNELSVLRNRAQVISVGEKTVSEISKILQSLDLGLATSPRQIIQKSGSVAAMLEHGLPVLVTRDDWRMRGTNGQSAEEFPDLFSAGQFALLETLPSRRYPLKAKCTVEQVAGWLANAMKLPLSAGELVQSK
jgi:glycosyltransferase involved in cell wall biosynthesis